MVSAQHAPAQGFIVPPGEGDPVPSKPHARVKASTYNTDNVVAVQEGVLLPDEAVTRHRHLNLTELFYVLEGEVLLQIGEQVTRARPGTFAFSPVGNVHSFRNIGATPARMLFIAMPPLAGEKYFEEMARMPPDADEAAWERLNRKWGVEVVGPPVEEGDDTPAASATSDRPAS